MSRLSVVLPAYNEEQMLAKTCRTLKKILDLAEINYELVIVDDGSTDQTWKIIEETAEKDRNVTGVHFSRNFGKEAAIYAGLKNASGDLVAIMDADLQDPSALLPEMYHAIMEEGYDSVATRRVDRKGEPPVRSFFARKFYKLMNNISNTDIVDGARDYRLMNRKFVNALLELGEYNRFSKGLFGWVGFKTKWIEFENVERVAGETKWSFWKLFRYSIEGIVAFSTAPLALAAVLGVIMCILGAIAIVFIVVRQLAFGNAVAGWASLACIILFLGGVQLLCLGILGSYMSKTYLEVKNRPIYICGETNIEKK